MDHESEQPPMSRWSTPFWVQVRATVIGGLILAGVLGLIALLASKVGKLSGGQVVTLVLVGLALILLVMLALLGRAVLRVARQWSAWQGDVSVHVLDLMATVRRLHLRDVISEAEQQGWSVYDDNDNDLVFEPPEGQPAWVRGIAPEPTHIARDLAEIAPGHFPDDWEPPPEVMTGAAGLARRLAELSGEVSELGEAIDHVERDVEIRTAQAALGMVAAEASTRGWEVTWFPDRAEFVNDQRSSIATVHYAEELDLVKLRQVLDLNRPLEKW